MKVALVHDYLKEYGGAERVLEALHELYPEAPVFTTVYLPEYLGPHKERFKNWDIRTSFLQKIPFKAKLISPFRLLSSYAFQSFDFSDFDVIITSATGAYFPNTLKKKNAKLICYCHTPPRYLYGYATAREWKKNVLLRIIGEIANHFLRMTDYHASRNVDQYIANSEEVKARIQKFYRKDAIVIYPPVDIPKNKPQKIKKKAYFLAGGRLAKPKHVDVIIRTCLELKLPLKVFGKGFAGYGEELQELVQSNDENRNELIAFVGEVSDGEKWELLSQANAYLFAAEDEDFGILPIEAMAAGTPVIAYRSGGPKETIVEGKTGVFFNELTVKSLAAAIQRFEKVKFDPEACRKHAEQFAKERFQEEIKQLLATIMKKAH